MTMTMPAAAASAAAADVSSEHEALSAQKFNPHLSSAVLLSTEMFDMLQGYSGTLGRFCTLISTVCHQ